MGKVAQYLHPSVRQKVLISAFLRATKDPFPPARVSGELDADSTWGIPGGRGDSGRRESETREYVAPVLVCHRLIVALGASSRVPP